MNLIKLVALANLFRKGETVANKEAWKSGQVTATVLGGAVMAGVQVAQAFGYDIPGVSEDAVTAVAGAVVSVVNIALTYITSEKVGILPAKESQE